eukprot:TRINITY_DN66852_c0_g1_i1.p1 TRINITY_DN66852_c0_g1~~TRINITY_DN66852_c0_g1_i1.p1  ORF type:complete len:447 (+),score=82.33 TRINITY_DN66852_c0_g1_i1:99-1439(+)
MPLPPKGRGSIDMQMFLKDVSSALQPPRAADGLRLLALEVDMRDPVGNPFGQGRVEINPWIPPGFLLPWPLLSSNADCLVSYGVPLSLANMLEDQFESADKSLQQVCLTYLLELLSLSTSAVDQMLGHKRMPMKVPRVSHGRCIDIISKINKLGKLRLSEVGTFGNSVGSESWTQMASMYEVWLLPTAISQGNPSADAGEICPVKVRLFGQASTAGAYDLGGKYLTGGRVWGGALFLARLVALASKAAVALPVAPATASLVNDERHFPLALGLGRVLELGAGLGLSGIALAKLGHEVVLSDREPALLERMRENIEANCVQKSCKVLDLDWAKAGEPKMRRMLAAQRFSAVIGSDLIYEDWQAELVVNVLKNALPAGGIGIFTNAKKHRKFSESTGLGYCLQQESGFEVVQGLIPCSGIIQQLVCGDFEPDQEYEAIAVRVPSQAQV